MTVATRDFRMTKKRQQVFDIVASSPDGIQTHEVAARLGIRSNGARHHLALLLAAGLIGTAGEHGDYRYVPINPSDS